MAENARIAVIGTGWWATEVHIPALLANPAAELVALCDADPARLRAAARAFGVGRTYTDHAAMLEQEPLDGAIIATPHATHFGLARACLARGLHVLVEKPLTLTAVDARALVELARGRGRELLVGYPWNYTAHARRLRALLSGGELGPVQLVTSVFNSFTFDLLRGRDRADDPGAYRVHGPGSVYSRPELSGGGHGHLQLTHSAGLLFFATGLRPRRVTALMHNHGLPLDLVDAIAVEFEGGALGMVGGTSNARPSAHTLHVHCAEGQVALDVMASAGQVYGPGAAREELPPLDEADRYPLRAPSANLVDVALGRAANGSPGEEGWRTVELLDAAYRSAHAGGRPVLVDELYGAGAG